MSEHFEKMIEELIRVVGNTNAVVAELKHDIKGIDNRISSIEQSISRIENDHGEKLPALFDAREVQIDVNERIIASLTRIESKLDKVTLKVAPTTQH